MPGSRVLIRLESGVVVLRSSIGIVAPLVGVFASVGASACASAPNAGPTPVEEPSTETRREVIRGGSGLASVIEYHPPSNRARVIDLRASADSLWPRVLAAYQSIGLPLGEIDSQQHTVGTSSVRVVGRLGDTRLGEYLDCGPGVLGSRAADTYVVTMRVTTELKPVAPAPSPSTTVRTVVGGVAKANATQGDQVDCVSTGALETRLVRLVAPKPVRTVGGTAPAP